MISYEYRKRLDWNKAMEPDVILPGGYKDREHEDRAEDQASLLEKFQKVFDLQIELSHKH